MGIFYAFFLQEYLGHDEFNQEIFGDGKYEQMGEVEHNDVCGTAN